MYQGAAIAQSPLRCEFHRQPGERGRFRVTFFEFSFSWFQKVEFDPNLLADGFGVSVFSAILTVHIVMGTLAIMAGVTALCLPKGQKLHRKIGSTFVLCMTAVGATGIALGLLRFSYFNIIIGIFTIYLTLTGWHAIKKIDARIGLVEKLSPAIAIFTGMIAGFITIWSLINNQEVSGMPAFLYMGFAIYGAIFACLDGLKIIRGGWSGASRIVDHVWRMIMALIFAVTALFVANPGVFPEALQQPHLQWAPVALLFAVLIYWLIRVLGGKWSFPGLSIE